MYNIEISMPLIKILKALLWLLWRIQIERSILGLHCSVYALFKSSSTYMCIGLVRGCSRDKAVST